MCGIVGLYLKNDTLKNLLGKMFVPLLVKMTGCGKNSAVYCNGNDAGMAKITVFHPNGEYTRKN